MLSDVWMLDTHLNKKLFIYKYIIQKNWIKYYEIYVNFILVKKSWFIKCILFGILVVTFKVFKLWFLL